MPSYDSTARVPFASGGKVGSKKPKIKRIILWKGKAKDWPGAKKAAERTKKAKGGHINVDAEMHKKLSNPDYGVKHTKKPKHLKKPKYDMEVDMGKVSQGVKYRSKKAQKKGIKKITSSKEYKKADYKKKTEMLGGKAFKKGGRAKDSVDQPGTHSWWLLNKNKRDKKAKGGEVGLDDYKKSRLSKWVKKYGAKGLRPQAKSEGGKADKNWIQGVNKSIKKRGTKGVCTGKKFGSASCPPGSKRYNLAKTFKKMARAKHASGGLVRFI